MSIIRQYYTAGTIVALGARAAMRGLGASGRGLKRGADSVAYVND